MSNEGMNEIEFDELAEEVKVLVFNNMKARVFGIIEQYANAFWDNDKERAKKIELMKKTLMPEIVYTSKKIEKFFENKSKEFYPTQDK